MSTVQAHSNIEVGYAANALLDEERIAQERRLTMRKIAHFATFFGTVLRDNQDSCLTRPAPAEFSHRRTLPQFALPAVPTSSGRRYYMVETLSGIRIGSATHQLGRRTDLVISEGEPLDYWAADGVIVGSLKPYPAGMQGAERQHTLSTPLGPVQSLDTLNNLVILTDTILAGHGIAPYPGFSE